MEYICHRDGETGRRRWRARARSSPGRYTASRVMVVPVWAVLVFVLPLPETVEAWARVHRPQLGGSCGRQCVGEGGNRGPHVYHSEVSGSVRIIGGRTGEGGNTLRVNIAAAAGGEGGGGGERQSEGGDAMQSSSAAGDVDDEGIEGVISREEEIPATRAELGPLPPHAEPHQKRARFELHRTWQSVTSVDIIEDGQIRGSRGGLPCQTELRWLDQPRNVLLLMKRGSTDILQRIADVTNFLQAREGVRVLVERQVRQDLQSYFGIHVAELYGARNTTNHHVDLVITLGGDGLLMHANWLFQRSAPIILPVNLGSLGFLLPFEYDDIYNVVEQTLTDSVRLTLRMRLHCRIFRNGSCVLDLVVMNDVVIERGSSPYMASLDCFCNGQYVTTVQADGIIIATPTGSTAYSMSAGGSMVHPGMQALLLTPICPHSLSFRPILFPDTAVLSLRMPPDARTNAWISFDGKFRHRLAVGDVLEVSKSEYPLPTVTHHNVTADWFRALNKAFNFNMRTRQKALPTSSLDAIAAQVPPLNTPPSPPPR